MARPLVQDRADLEENVRYLIGRLESPSTRVAEYARRLVAAGNNYVVCRDPSGTMWFGPSRFVGHRVNTLDAHQGDPGDHGGSTDETITRVLGTAPTRDNTLESAFQIFCASFDIRPHDRLREYWSVLECGSTLSRDCRGLLVPTTSPRTRAADSPGPSPTEYRRPQIDVLTSGVHQEVQKHIRAVALEHGWTIAHVADLGVLPDLVVESSAVPARRIVFEVKSCSGASSAYEGIGQLLLYRELLWSKDPATRLALVMPEEGMLDEQWMDALRQLDIAVLYFIRVRGQVQVENLLEWLRSG